MNSSKYQQPLYVNWSKRFIAYGLPYRHTDGLELPGGWYVQREGDQSKEVWKLNLKGYAKQTLTGFSDAVVADNFSEEEQHALDRFAQYRTHKRYVLRYGGFILDHLYLDREHVPTSPHLIIRAAIIARLLLRFWHARQEQGDTDALFALPMLWRSYWRALFWLMCHTDDDAYVEEIHRWRDIGLQNEYERAWDTWNQMIISDDHAWFFADVLMGWVAPPFGTWQMLRECEVQQMVWQDAAMVTGRWSVRLTHRRLLPPGTDTAATRRRLEVLSSQWYLPRYDLVSSGQLRVRLAGSDSCCKGVFIWFTLPLSVTRLYAAIGAGYAATALQNDTWQILVDLIADRRLLVQMPLLPFIPLWVLMTMLVGLGTLVYLWVGIMRKTGIGSWHSGNRALWLWIHGELGAMVLGTILFVVLAPAITIDTALGEQSLLELASSQWAQFMHIQLPIIPIGLILIYAQIALFFGVFLQLLFDNRPTTTPLDAP